MLYTSEIMPIKVNPPIIMVTKQNEGEKISLSNIESSSQPPTTTTMTESKLSESIDGRAAPKLIQNQPNREVSSAHPASRTVEGLQKQEKPEQQ